MLSIQALRERLNALNLQANALLADKGAQIWSKEDQDKFDGLMDEAGRVKAQITATQRMLDADAENQLEDAARQAAKNGAKGGAGNNGQLSVRDAVALYMRHGNNVSAEQAIAIRNAMSTTTNSEGGFTVATTVATELIESLKAYGGMREVADIITMESGNPLGYPTNDATSEEGIEVAENDPAPVGETTFGTVPLNVWMYTSKQIAIPLQLIQDSSIDVIGLVFRILAARLGRITNKRYTLGSGTGQAFGVVTRAGAGKVGASGQTTTVTYDDLEDLQRSVNRAYRGNARFMMADATVGKIRKIKDLDGRPIFAPSLDASLTSAEPDRLLGKPIAINDDVPVMAASAKSILFGDFQRYKIRDAMDVMIRRFDDSAFALKGQVGFCGWMRTGGNLVDTAAVKTYQNAAS